MHYSDDRTEAQRETHQYAVVGTDSFMSGWGGAEGGASIAAWAFRDGMQADVESWVRHRRDMKRVRVVCLKTWRPRGAHVHVYVVEPGHPALSAVRYADVLPAVL